MKSYKVSLKETYGLEGGELECMLSESPFDVPSPEWRRPAVVVVPGGGYCMVSKREGEPVANYFLAKGFQTFILTYRTCTEGSCYPEQLIELAAAMDYIKKNAAECLVNPEEIFVVGFSAGGPFGRGFSGGVCVRQRESGHGARLSSQSHRIGVSRHLFQVRA